MNRLTKGGIASLLVKPLALEDEFFSLLDKLKEQTLRELIPILVELLHEFDRLLGFDRHPDFTTALDARLFYLTFDLLKKQIRIDVAIFARNCGVFRKDQLDGINRTELPLIEDNTKERRPVALLPLLRFRREALVTGRRGGGILRK